jgi:hypothetical protein
LTRLDEFFAREIAAKRVPGAVVAIARDGKLVHYKAYGQLDPTKGTPMPPDAIFALASMTKPASAISRSMTSGERPWCVLRSRVQRCPRSRCSEAILDAHYLGRDIQLAEAAVLKLEARTKL